eukprot:766889-Hanusia_phi.AAC.2
MSPADFPSRESPSSCRISSPTLTCTRLDKEARGVLERGGREGRKGEGRTGKQERKGGEEGTKGEGSRGENERRGREEQGTGRGEMKGSEISTHVGLVHQFLLDEKFSILVCVLVIAMPLPSSRLLCSALPPSFTPFSLIATLADFLCIYLPILASLLASTSSLPPPHPPSTR